jgi:hypothetical protein
MQPSGKGGLGSSIEKGKGEVLAKAVARAQGCSKVRASGWREGEWGCVGWALRPQGVHTTPFAAF